MTPLSTAAEGDAYPCSFFGKPRGWTRGWTIVVLVWVAAAVGLAAIRVDMGHLSVLSAREQTALSEVQTGQLQPGVSNAKALAAVVKRFAPGDKPTWFVTDRHWERRLYVVWEVGKYEPLTWTVGYDGTITAAAQTRLVLKQALSAPAPTPTTLPSLPPGL